MSLTRENDIIRKSGWLHKECKKVGKVSRFFRLSGQLLTNHCDENSLETWRMNMFRKTVKGFAPQRKIIISSSLENLSQRRSLGRVALFASSEEEFYDWYWSLSRSANRCVHDDYSSFSWPGLGARSEVFMARNKSTCENVAIKSIKKDWTPRNNANILREIHVMRSTQHENLVKAIAVYEDMNTVYIVMEFVEGGTLEDLSRELGFVQESHVKHIMKDVLEGIAYLHDRGIVHCDLKLTNLLRVGHALPCSVKIADFGFANFTRYSSMSESMLHSPNESNLYVAPEIIQDLPYGASVDCWSVGVIMYRLLTGRFPFRSETVIEQTWDILNEEISFETGTSEDLDISGNAKDLIRRLLEKSPTNRISARDALHHSWFN